MSGERKLSLVKPPPAAAPDAAPSARPYHDLPSDEPEVSEDEIRRAEALREALEHEGDEGDESDVALDPVAAALRAAWRPEALAVDDLEAILSRALGDIDAPATRVETREAEGLRGVLDAHDAERAGRLVRGPGARRLTLDQGSALMAVALRAAWAPSAVPVARNEMLISRALDAASMTAGTTAEAPEKVATAPSASVELNPPWRGLQASTAANHDGGAGAKAPISLRRFRSGPRTFATMAAVVAMAAAVFVLVGRVGQRADAPTASVAQAPAASQGPTPERVPRIASRSTAALFDAATPFPRSGGESARVDRIAGARAADLRANRFAAWGVR